MAAKAMRHDTWENEARVQGRVVGAEGKMPPSWDFVEKMASEGSGVSR